MMTSTNAEIQQKITEYSGFVEQVLRPQLEVAEKERLKAKTTIEEYKDLQKQLYDWKNEANRRLETLVDLGYKTIYCRAVAENVNMIYVHVGMGFHVELQIPEALEFVEKRIKFLEEDVLSGKEKKVTQVSDHIQSANIILDKLESEMQNRGRGR